MYPDPRLVEFDGRTLTVEDAGPPSGFQWDDWCAFLGPWGFKLDAITAPVSLWHGMADKRCPPGHGRWLAQQIPKVAAHFPADEDHINIEENNRGTAYTWIRGQVQ